MPSSTREVVIRLKDGAVADVVVEDPWEEKICIRLEGPKRQTFWISYNTFDTRWFYIRNASKSVIKRISTQFSIPKRRKGKK